MQHPDIIVIGGGPGGSTAATMLARKGFSVLLFEKERFPREHVGESLLPATMPILEDLGVMDDVKNAGFTEKWGATMVWGSGHQRWSWYFAETNKRYPHTFQVWRPKFDQLLLENARRHGVDVRERHQVLEVLFEEGRATGVRYLDSLGLEETVTARFIVDASGQAALLGNRLRLREWDPFFQNLAVYAYYRDTARLPAPDQGNILVEAYEDGWLWNIPLQPDLMSVGAVLDRKRGQEGLKGVDPKAFLEEQISQGSHSSELLRGATLHAGPYILKDWSYVSKQVVGDGFILVGDAACFIDPLFSSGVHLAMSAGVLASAYITTLFRDPEMGPAAAEVYRELYSRQYDHFHQMASLFYSSNRTKDSYFWETRRLFDRDGRFTPREAFVRAVAGQPLRGYERVVLEHGEAPASFVESVHELETDRQRREAHAATLRAAGPDGNPPIAHAVPRLPDGARLVRKPILGDGEFVWGHVLTVAGRTDGTECSEFVTAVVALIDGSRTVADIVGRLAAGGADPDRIFPIVVNAVSILYADGSIESLEPAGEPAAARERARE